MNLRRKIGHILFVMILYLYVSEARGEKWKKTTKKFTKSKHKGKKQFFPAGHAGYPSPLPNNYPSPYPPGRLKPAADSIQEVKFVKGLPAGYDCIRSKFGCCWDGRTPAHGEAGRGCPQCRDVYKNFCKVTKNLCHFPMVADYCRITCKLCSKKKKKSCQMSKYNCCWDGTSSAKGPKCEGCPEIRDKLTDECKAFETECLRNPYFMWTKCRKTCLNILPPIEPFLQRLTPSGNLEATPPYGQPAMMPPGMPPTHTAAGALYPYPFPGMPQGNSTIGKKTAPITKKHKKGHSHHRSIHSHMSN